MPINSSEFLEFELCLGKKYFVWGTYYRGGHNSHISQKKLTMPPSIMGSMTPLNEEQQQRFDAQVVRVNLLMVQRHIDKSYQNEYKNFVYWVEGTNMREGEKYIHREAVDAYFAQAVVLRKVGKDSISRIGEALEWFYKHLESRNCPEFSYKSGVVVSEAISQQVENRRNMPNTALGTDPHKGLKDVLPEADRVKLLTHIHRTRADWGSLGTSFSWGNNAGIRGASSRSLVFVDLFMSRGVGTTRDGDTARTLILVLRKGPIHKDNHASDGMVGSYRHRVYILCSIFNVSLHVINLLRQDDEIHFYHYDPLTTRAIWWDKQLILYETLSHESGPMQQVYDATGVKGCKLTHNRTYAVQQAGSEGLAPHQVSSLTKHMQDKLNKCYLPEVDKEACRVMAGFSKHEAYFVGREHLILPLEIGVLIRTLLPRYDTWLAQAASPHGDKSTACKTFLQDIIPYMVQVIVQDGIYLIRDFPEHVMSNFLKVCNT
jgi:hypothetical protein